MSARFDHSRFDGGRFAGSRFGVPVSEPVEPQIVQDVAAGVIYIEDNDYEGPFSFQGAGWPYAEFNVEHTLIFPMTGANECQFLVDPIIDSADGTPQEGEAASVTVPALPAVRGDATITAQYEADPVGDTAGVDDPLLTWTMVAGDNSVDLTVTVDGVPYVATSNTINAAPLAPTADPPLPAGNVKATSLSVTAGTFYSLGSIDFGAADPNRWVYFAQGSNSGTQFIYLDQIRLGGTGGITIGTLTDFRGQGRSLHRHGKGLYTPGGLTEVEVSFLGSGTLESLAVQMYTNTTEYNIVSTQPAQADGGATDPTNLYLADVPENGIAMLSGATRPGGSVINNITGVVLDYNSETLDPGVSPIKIGSYRATTAEVGRQFTIDLSGTNRSAGLVIWGPV